MFEDFVVVAFDTKKNENVILAFHKHYEGAQHIATMVPGVDLPLKDGQPDWSASGRYVNVTIFQKYDSIRE